MNFLKIFLSFIVLSTFCFEALAQSTKARPLLECEVTGSSRYKIVDLKVVNLSDTQADATTYNLSYRLADESWKPTCEGEQSRSLEVKETINENGEISGFYMPIADNERRYTFVTYTDNYYGSDDSKVYFDAKLTANSLPCSNLISFNEITLYCSQLK